MRRKRRLINAVPRLSKAIEHQINRQQPGRRMGALATGDLAISNALPASDRSDADELDLRIPVGDTPALGALALIPLVAVVAMVLLVMLLLKIRAFHRDRKQLARLKYVYDLLERPEGEIDSIAVALNEGDESPFFQPTQKYKALTLDVRRLSNTSEIFMHFSRLENMV